MRARLGWLLVSMSLWVGCDGEVAPLDAGTGEVDAPGMDAGSIDARGLFRSSAPPSVRTIAAVSTASDADALPPVIERKSGVVSLVGLAVPHAIVSPGFNAVSPTEGQNPNQFTAAGTASNFVATFSTQ